MLCLICTSLKVPVLLENLKTPYCRTPCIFYFQDIIATGSCAQFRCIGVEDMVPETSKPCHQVNFRSPFTPLIYSYFYFSAPCSFYDLPTWSILLNIFGQDFIPCFLKSTIILEAWFAGHCERSARSPLVLIAWAVLFSPSDHTIKLFSLPTKGLFVSEQMRSDTNSNWLIAT